MLIPLTLVLEKAFRDAGIPIDGVSVGDPLNRATWAAFYQATATAQQRTQGDGIIATLDPNDATLMMEVKGDIIAGQADSDLLRAIVQGLWEAINAPLLTKAQLRARIIQIFKSL